MGHVPGRWPECIFSSSNPVVAKISAANANASMNNHSNHNDTMQTILRNSGSQYTFPTGSSNDGKQLLAAGESRGQTDIELEKMSYLVEGVKGAIE